MSEEELLQELIAFNNEQFQFQQFLSFCKEKGYNQIDVEKAIKQAEE